MPYIIDGHNLIPHIPGIDLSDLDDENSLIKVLQKYASQRRSRIEVYFDQAPVTQSGTHTHGLVKAHYVKSNSTADHAIKNRLTRLGNSAKNWTVVSSDREVLAEARSCHCEVLSSSEFAGMLINGPLPDGPSDGKNDQPEVSEDEVDYWLDQFDIK